MMEPVVYELHKILLGLVTNSQEQAMRWAAIIVERLRAADISIEEMSVLQQMIDDCKSPEASA
jgi:hypothetical protein